MVEGVLRGSKAMKWLIIYDKDKNQIVAWKPRVAGKTTLPELIKGQAEGTLKLINGTVYEWEGAVWGRRVC